eukprot:1158181-Pelagomonas_calceolata.AAC.7
MPAQPATSHLQASSMLACSQCLLQSRVCCLLAAIACCMLEASACCRLLASVCSMLQVILLACLRPVSAAGFWPVFAACFRSYSRKLETGSLLQTCDQLIAGFVLRR